LSIDNYQLTIENGETSRSCVLPNPSFLRSAWERQDAERPRIYSNGDRWNEKRGGIINCQLTIIN